MFDFLCHSVMELIVMFIGSNLLKLSLNLSPLPFPAFYLQQTDELISVESESYSITSLLFLFLRQQWKLQFQGPKSRKSF